MAILWTEDSTKPLPFEYAQLILMRDVYHCTPTEFAKQPLDRVLLDLELIGVEQKVRKFREDSKKKKRR